MNWNRLPDYTDIAIIGAGPHSLTLMTHLLQKRAKLRSRVMIFDLSGEWLSSWHNQLAAQEIPHLRSQRATLSDRLRYTIPILTPLA